MSAQTGPLSSPRFGLHRTVVLGGLSFLTILVSFISQWYVVARLGAGSATDAFFAGMAVHLLVFDTVRGSLVYVLVPLLSTESDEACRQESWNILQVVALLFGVLVFILVVTVPYWVWVVAPGFSADTQMLTVSLVRIQLLGTWFLALSGVLWCHYYSRERFVWVESISALAMIIAFIFLVWAVGIFGITGAAWSFVVRSMTEFVLLVFRLGRYSPLRWNTYVLREMWRRIRPVILGATYYRTDFLVDRMLASLAPAGLLSLFALSRQMHHAGARILNRAIAAPMVPQLAQQADRGDWHRFQHTYRFRLLWCGGISAMAVLALIWMGEPIFSYVFGWTRVSQSEVHSFWWITVILSGVILGDPAVQILANAFYAKGDTTTPTRIGVFSYTIGVALRVGGFYLWGIWGLALGLSVYFGLHSALLGIFLVKAITVPVEGRTAH